MTDGNAARDKGIAAVSSRNREWLDEAYVLVGISNLIPIGWIGTGEDIRFKLIPYIGKPTHPNAWGALMNGLLSNKRGWFKPTGNWKTPVDTPSHSRPIREYQRVIAPSKDNLWPV